MNKVFILTSSLSAATLILLLVILRIEKTR